MIATLLDRIDQLIAATRTAHLDRWLDADGVGALLGYTAAQVRERIACRPDFPAPLRIGGGHARWRTSEIQAWAEREREKHNARRQSSRAAISADERR